MYKVKTIYAMKVIHPSHGHLTANEKAAIKALIERKLNTGKVGRTSYFMRPIGHGEWSVTIRKAGRGLGFIGDPLRMEQRTLTIITGFVIVP